MLPTFPTEHSVESVTVPDEEPEDAYGSEGDDEDVEDNEDVVDDADADTDLDVDEFLNPSGSIGGNDMTK